MHGFYSFPPKTLVRTAGSVPAGITADWLEGPGNSGVLLVVPTDGKRKLSEYQAKRNFTKTAEPSGKARVKPAEHLRFVIQKHAASRLHYDLRLELDGVFKSWAVTKGPSLDPRDRRLAVEVEDHPLDYGDFEGTIPQGEYGGGTVMLWDRGFWAADGGGDPERAWRKGDLKITLAGEKLQGSWVLVRMRHDRERGLSKRNNWLPRASAPSERCVWACRIPRMSESATRPGKSRPVSANSISPRPSRSSGSMNCRPSAA